ncbi:MAG TPA: hypothetical protein ENG14_05740 [Thermodesulforhabdus norvegica]|uniref:Deoxyhypusine synthase n=1 Tax=Thermodesulforhabdus norvegica TaxID=39841 RepID=A0A7C1AM97_9BACT|nr:hypothetical protein [Thermodesulforhabdus norvegica]
MEWTPLNLENFKTYSIYDRINKARVEQFSKLWSRNIKISEFINILPESFAADDLRKVIKHTANAITHGRTVLLGMGAHPIKVGLSPILIQALKNGVFTGFATNGAGLIHDVEVALCGGTSENVSAHIRNGSFGAVRETAEFIHGAIADGLKRFPEKGLGWNVGRFVFDYDLPYRRYSIFATAYELDIPATVHVAIGTDIVHMHPKMDGAAMGALSHTDFRIFSHAVSTLDQGIYINLGSAVVMPEVFLKAVSLVRNLGYTLEDFATVNFDFQVHYRPLKNVVERPVAPKGKGYNLVGHHEIMFPLFLCAVMEEMVKHNGDSVE